MKKLFVIICFLDANSKAFFISRNSFFSVSSAFILSFSKKFSTCLLVTRCYIRIRFYFAIFKSFFFIFICNVNNRIFILLDNLFFHPMFFNILYIFDKFFICLFSCIASKLLSYCFPAYYSCLNLIVLHSI